nr:Jag N-terminal domain-containing protein [Planococcus halocryophilus]
MKQITQTGLTVEKAISEALEKLQVTREEVKITVIQEEKKGFSVLVPKKQRLKLLSLKNNIF